ncbi:hypothetical protein TOPH_06133, partial [Tolypocladium ophioglossoides CBS 100239]
LTWGFTIGDEKLPVCGQCAKTGQYCIRPAKPTQFIDYAKTKARRDEPTLGFPVNPSEALKNPDMAHYFHHYISDVASWYDLGDSSRRFATVVSEMALGEPLLFSAVIALSAMHISQTTAKTAMRAAQFYHGHCVRQLIALHEENPLLENGVALAAACLLRSYEILDEDVDPNRHLQGAYSLASRERLLGDPSATALFTAGFWNYLREDITFSLFELCPLKIDLSAVGPLSADSGHNQLNGMSMILGQIINAAFDRSASEDEWTALLSATKSCYDMFPARQRPFSRAVRPVEALPRVWLLQDSHASAMHYFLTACCILAVFAPPDRLSSLPAEHDAGERQGRSRADILEAYATEICGIAFTTRIPSVLVNAFGPISYCAKFIQQQAVRQEVIRNLNGCKKVIGWPVGRLITDLQASWTDP